MTLPHYLTLNLAILIVPISNAPKSIRLGISHAYSYHLKHGHLCQEVSYSWRQHLTTCKQMDCFSSSRTALRKSVKWLLKKKNSIEVMTTSSSCSQHRSVPEMVKKSDTSAEQNKASKSQWNLKPNNQLQMKMNKWHLPQMKTRKTKNWMTSQTYPWKKKKKNLTDVLTKSWQSQWRARSNWIKIYQL